MRGWWWLLVWAALGCDSGDSDDEGPDGAVDAAVSPGDDAGSGDGGATDCAAPCQNGGTCLPAEGRCDCPAGFDGAQCETPTSCEPGVELVYAGTDLPEGLAGRYQEASDCEPDEGGSTFGGYFAQCFRKVDGSAWRIWNTGCGWEVGRREPAGGAQTLWAFYARTYAGRCNQVPAEQLAPSILATAPLLDMAGDPIEGLASSYCPGDAPMCRPGVQLLSAGGLPDEFTGYYAEAFDCMLNEGGAWFGGDFWHCFRKQGGSAARIWNTGCGWELGRREPVGDGMTQWVRVGRTYSGQCNALPPDQLDTRALTGDVFLDEMAAPIEATATYCEGPRPMCQPGVAVTYEGDLLPSDLAGHYVEATNCVIEEGGAAFGNDFTRCFRKNDGSAWRIWNSSCGWEIGRPEPLEDGMTRWTRYVHTYTGQCNAVPPDQRDTRALTTNVFYDGMSMPLAGLSTTYCAGL